MQRYNDGNFILLKNFFVKFLLLEDIPTKSETYQKEGWSILEADNQVFGKNAGAVDSNINLESEDFNFYHQNKEKAVNDINCSAKELTDFIDIITNDIPEPSQEEIDAGIKSILQKTHPDEYENKAVKSKKSKKVTFKVLFLAAVLSVVCFTSLFAVGNSHNISIDNGFISFAKETVQVVFFGEDEKDFISVDTLLKDLEKHGYGDILFPEIFITNSDEYKVSLPRYRDNEFRQVAFDIHCKDKTIKFIVHNYNSQQQSFGHINVDNMKTLTVNDVSVYITEYDQVCVAEFVCDEYRYFIEAGIPYSELVSIVNTFN